MKQSPSLLAYGLLLATSVVSFGGPFLLMLVIGGGRNPKWPPDRPIEWITFGVVMTIACVLFLLCLSIRLWLPRMQSTGANPAPSSKSSDVD